MEREDERYARPEPAPLYAHSLTIGKVAEALAKAQAKIEVAARDKEAQIKSDKGTFKYAYTDLAGIWGACRDALAANELAVSQFVTSAGTSQVTVTTLLMHSSGEWLRAGLTITARGTGPQDIGIVTTYARKYGLAAMVGVATDVDDDAAEQAPPQQQGGGSWGRRPPGPPAEDFRPPPEDYGSGPPAGTPPRQQLDTATEASIGEWKETIAEVPDTPSLKRIAVQMNKLPPVVKAAIREAYEARRKALEAEGV